MNGRRAAWPAAVLLLGACTAPPGPWQPLFDGTLAGWSESQFGGDGTVTVLPEGVELGIGAPLTGITRTGPVPQGDYELRAEITRLQGSDFFCGLTFPVAGSHLTAVIGGWGGSLCGFSSLDGLDAAHNETRRHRRFERGRPYELHLRVTDQRVELRIDGDLVTAAELAGRQLSLRPEVLLSRPFGVASFATHARFRQLCWRPLRP